MDKISAEKLLGDEYLLLQKRIEEFDARLLTIEAWSVTFAATAIGLAWHENSPRLLWVSAISAFAFWLVEANVKSHQRAHYPRITEIEASFADPNIVIHPMQISKSWNQALHHQGKVRRFLESMSFPVVCLPHILIIVTALAFYFLSPPNEAPPPPAASNQG